MSSFLSRELTLRLFNAAQDKRPVAGWTHNFYRYPARFSPKFVSEAIQCFSKPGSLLLDPYVGGGTTAVEALASGRRIVGNDLNSLAAFVTEVKTTPLSPHEVKGLRRWADREVPNLTYRTPFTVVEPYIDLQKTKNLNLVRARFLKKLIATALATIEKLPSTNSKSVARCALLCTAQKALDGRKRQTSLPEFRCQLSIAAHMMLDHLETFRAQLGDKVDYRDHCLITNGDASQLHQLPIFAQLGEKVSLVLTSPPYPGVHILYHRWQVDGRRETPAPYWIAGTQDGQGASFYNLGDRREQGTNTYFNTSLQNLVSIRRVMKRGALMVQMLAFADPPQQLPRYLSNMETAGFEEIFADPTITNGTNRIWRDVPNRKWHATMNGRTCSSREVVLIHRAR